MGRAEDLYVMVLNFIVGTAAELIKIYPVFRLAKERGHLARLLATGQSRENLLMQVRDFGLPVAELGWLIESHGDLTTSYSALKWFIRALCASKRALRRQVESGFVVVHGDTLSTLVGARLGRRLRLPVVHIEAGLRSPHLLNPFPEEINRRLVSRRTQFHMAPDAAAERNLKQARVGGEVACTGGNTLMDAVHLSGAASGPASAKFVLVNIHRFENLNSATRWKIIVECVVRASRDLDVIFVTHPQTRHKLEQDAEAAQLLREARIQLRERMPFSQFIGLLKAAEYLITDGGSNQEECSYLGKPCLILRESTERREGLDSCCVLSRFDAKVIGDFLNDPAKFQRTPDTQVSSPSEIIVNFLERR